MEYDFSNEIKKLAQSTVTFSDVCSWLEIVNDDLAFIVWSKNKNVIYVSKNIEQLINIKLDDVYGDNWKKSLPEQMIVHINIILHELKFKKTTEIETFKCHKKLVQYKIGHLEMNGTPYVFCQIKDISNMIILENKLKKLEHSFVHAEQMAIAGEFSAGIVHEIRNPLTSLKGFLQLVQAGIEQKEEYYQVMIQEIDKIESITTDLLTMSKPFNDQMESVLLINLIKDTIIIMKLQDKFNEIVFEVNCNEEVTIFCNEQKIKQVLINLFKNASEAMNFHGEIIINVIDTDESVRLEIIDQGGGVSDDVIYEIDKPFYTTKETGTGLGLVITKYILEAHQAALNITSEEGKGSNFEITFPKKVE